MRLFANNAICWILTAIMIISIHCSADNRITGLKIHFESSSDASPGHEYRVNIIIDAFREDFDNYRLRIAFSNSVFEVIDIKPGDLFENLQWRNFENQSSFCDTGGIIENIEISADRKSDLNDSLKLIISSSDNIELATIDFLVTEDSVYGCTWQLFRFFWTGCQDNTIILSDRNEMYILQNVLDADYTEIPASDKLPNFSLNYNHCTDEMNRTKEITAYPIIKFINQAVWIICAVDIDDRGDINLN